MDEVIVKLLGLLEQLVEEKGVPVKDELASKNISKGASLNNNEKVSKDGLSSNDKKTLTETFNLFNKLFFDYQKTTIDDTAQKTIVGKIAQDQTKAEDPQTLTDKSECGGGFLSMILGGLALLAGSVATIFASMSGFFGDTGSKVAEVIGKVGFMGALKILSKTVLKQFSKTVLKKLPIIGGIIGLYFAYEAFKAGKFFKGVAELISAFLNFVPYIGPMLSIGADILIAFAESKGMFDEGGALSAENGWKTIKGWMGALGKAIVDNALYLPIIGTFKRFGMSYDAFKTGNMKEGLKQLGLGLLTILPTGGHIIKGVEVLAGWLGSSKTTDGKITPDSSWMDRLKGWIKSKLKDLPDWLSAPLKWFGIMEDDSKGNGGVVVGGVKDGAKAISAYVTDTWNNMKGPMKDAAGAIGELTKRAWDSTSKFASDTWDSVSENAPKVWNTIKEYSTAAWDKAKEAGSWFADSISKMAARTTDMINTWIPNIVTTITDIASNAMKVLKGLVKKIGGAIAGIFTSADDTAKAKKVVKSTKEKMLSDSRGDMSLHLLTASNTHNLWLKLLYKSSNEQVRLLTSLANTGAESLKELKRMSGSPSGGNVTVVSPSSPQPAPKTPSIKIPNNRQSYGDSAYAL